MQKTIRDGLILRSLSVGPLEDRAGLKSLYHEVFRDEMDDWELPEDDVWVDTLLSGGHPTVTDDDIWIVVDPAKDNKVVSSVLLIPQVWHYETIELPVGRPELVVTSPDYRHRGLVRELFNACHERSESLGHIMQGITGIPHYYRRFGYTMAVELDRFATIPLAAVPKLKDDQKAHYSLRVATEADYPKMAKWDAYVAPHFTLSTVNQPDYWPYYLKNPKNSVQVIADSAGDAIGYVALGRWADSEWVNCNTYVVNDKTSLLATYDDVLRGIKTHAESTWPDNTPVYIGFSAGQLPALSTLISRTGPANVTRRPYAWYIRVADLPRFINHIKPVLEQRLVNSAAHRYTGSLEIHFYDLTGIRIQFKEGCIESVEPYKIHKPADEFTCDAAFAYDTFLDVLFGHRNFDQIRSVLTETWANRKAEVLLDILFPLKPSRILPL